MHLCIIYAHLCINYAQLCINYALVYNLCTNVHNLYTNVHNLCTVATFMHCGPPRRLGGRRHRHHVGSVLVARRDTSSPAPHITRTLVGKGDKFVWGETAADRKPANPMARGEVVAVGPDVRQLYDLTKTQCTHTCFSCTHRHARAPRTSAHARQCVGRGLQWQKHARDSLPDHLPQLRTV